jgi:Family of unknown function (DUF6223)
MSHSEALSRLNVGCKSDMIRRALRRAIDKLERDWNYDAGYLRDMIDVSPRSAWRFSRVTDLLAAAVVVGFGLAAPAAAQVAVQPAAVSVYTMSPGRIGAIVAVVVGLIGVVIGGLALARSAGRIGTGNGRRGAIVALVLGPIGLVIGGLVVATADGGVGTGNGLGGGIVAMTVGLLGMALGGLALTRSRRTA